MWTMLGIAGGCLILIGGVVWMTSRLSYIRGKSEVKQAIAEDEAERMRHDAEIASKPYPKRPLDELFK